MVVNPTTVLHELASALLWISYGSFFEWFWHKYWMHQRRPPRLAFYGHTVQHHGIYRGDGSFYVEEEGHTDHILLKPYALPGIVALHLPVMMLINHFVHYTLFGGVAGVVAYFLVYEYMHWNMHVPRNHFVERFRWFQFLRAHHHLHHRFMQSNFCVLNPLADLLLRTLITQKTIDARRALREQQISDGTYGKTPRPAKRSDTVKLSRFAASSLAKAARASRGERRSASRARVRLEIEAMWEKRRSGPRDR
ncbi:MAG: hypothetical protein KGJ62_00885 [Armatimonadetes bacterium]|nr:hypothetical protein [Armatimonadota bacterium]MDE2205102.1 hypothetical protein [Armatimonadota bacterium]